MSGPNVRYRVNFVAYIRTPGHSTNSSAHTKLMHSPGHTHLRIHAMCTHSHSPRPGKAGMQPDAPCCSLAHSSGVRRLEIMASRCAPPRNHGIRARVVALYLVACVPPHERAPVPSALHQTTKGGIKFLSSCPRAHGAAHKKPGIPVVCQQGEYSRYDNMVPSCALNSSAGRRRGRRTSPHKSWWRSGFDSVVK